MEISRDMEIEIYVCVYLDIYRERDKDIEIDHKYIAAGRNGKDRPYQNLKQKNVPI